MRFTSRSSVVCGARSPRWLRAIGLGALALMASVLGRATSAGAAREYSVKAAFLYNFTKFIDWPEGSFARGDDPFTIAIFGDDPFEGELNKAVKGRRIAGRPIVVRPCRAVAEAITAQMIFVASDDASTRELLARVGNRPIVTVGESERFVREGGTIGFVFDEGDERVRFAINMTVADRARLRVNAQLQKLAKTVRRDQ